MARQWYWSCRWRQRSHAQLREHPLCAMCAKNGLVTAAKVADHIKPHRGVWNEFWLGALQSLCKPCHDAVKTSEENRQYNNQERGYALDIGADGWPLDPKHPTYRIKDRVVPQSQQVRSKDPDKDQDIRLPWEPT